MLISTHGLSKTFGARTLFSGLAFTIEEGDRIGLIGPNGAGKSTLLKILSGEISTFDGTVSKKQGLTIGYLEQNPSFAKDATLWSTMIEKAYDPDEWESQSLAHQYISKMGLGIFDLETPIQNLSGGWKKRIALARELIKKPDLLLLDEPTNHMDIEAISWLEDFLSKARFATLTITHDRLFLQRVSNRIIEIDPRHQDGLLQVRGNYTQYLEIRNQLILSQEKRELILKNTLRRETQWLRQGVKARTTKQKARIEQAGQLEEQVNQIAQRNINKTARLSFVGADRFPKKLIEAKNIKKTFGDITLFENFNIILAPKSRIGLLGENGAGKSTLIRILLGLEEPTSGEVIQSEKLKVAYFDQNRENLDPTQTLAQTLCPNGDHVEFNGQFVHIRSYLDRFLFTSEQFGMKVGDLSGGEQSRLLVARLMLQPANVLILDEPTNDLDIATLNILEECLQDFPGAIVLVTHDRYFLDQVSNELLAFPSKDASSKDLTTFASFTQWEQWHTENTLKKPSSNKQASNSSSKKQKKTKLSFKQQYELDHMQETLDQLEINLKNLEKQSTQPDIVNNPGKLQEITEQMSKTQLEIDKQFERWQELETLQKLYA